MKLNFSKFKKVHSDEKSTTLMHPSGHKIVIAHQSLQPEHRKELSELPKMADGGQVQEDANRTEQLRNRDGILKQNQVDALKKSAPNPNAAGPGYAEGGKVDKSPYTNKADAAEVEKGATESGWQPARWADNIKHAFDPAPEPKASPQPSYADGGDVSSQAQDSPDQIAADAGQQQAPVVVNVNGQGATQSGQSQLAPEDQQAVDLVKRLAPTLGAGGQPGAPQATPANPQQAAPQMAAQPQAAQDPYGTQSASNSYMQGLGQQAQGIAGEAQAQGAMSKADLAAHQQQQDALQSIAKSTNDGIQKYMGQADAFLKDLSDPANKINPNHYYDQFSTAQKIGNAIGMILGGAGAGATGGPNTVLEYVNKQIDRDIESQKANIGRKQNLFSAALQMTGNVRDAGTYASALQQMVTANKIAQAADAQGDPLAKSRALQAVGVMRQQASDKIRSMALNQSMMKAMQDSAHDPSQMGNFLQAARLVNPELAKDMQSRYIPGVGIAQVPVPDNLRQKMAAAQFADSKLQELEDFAKKNSGTVLDRATVNKGKAMAADLQNVIRTAKDQGVYKESEANFMLKSIPDDPTAFFASTRTLPKYQVIRKNTRDELNNLYKNYGINQPQIQVAPPVAPTK